MNVTHALEYLRKDDQFKDLKYEVFRHKLKAKDSLNGKNGGLLLKEIFVSGPHLKAISFKWMVPITDGIVRMSGA